MNQVSLRDPRQGPAHRPTLQRLQAASAAVPPPVAALCERRKPRPQRLLRRSGVTLCGSVFPSVIDRRYSRCKPRPQLLLPPSSGTALRNSASEIAKLQASGHGASVADWSASAGPTGARGPPGLLAGKSSHGEAQTRPFPPSNSNGARVMKHDASEARGCRQPRVDVVEPPAPRMSPRGLPAGVGPQGRIVARGPPQSRAAGPP